MSKQPPSLQPGASAAASLAAQPLASRLPTWHGMVATRRSTTRSQRCLVTGGAGFLGRHLVERLLATGGWQVGTSVRQGKSCCALLGVCLWWSCQCGPSPSGGRLSPSAWPHPAAGTLVSSVSASQCLCALAECLQQGLRSALGPSWCVCMPSHASALANAARPGISSTGRHVAQFQAA